MAEIRTLVRPAKLYRYRSMDGAQRIQQELAAIETGYLWCSGFRQMNDPMEGLYEVDEAFRNDPDFADFRNRVYHGKLDVGICSLSETGTNELMWAHYADQYEGICIEYDLPRLLDALPGNVDVVRLHYDDTLLRNPDQLRRSLLLTLRPWAYQPPGSNSPLDETLGAGQRETGGAPTMFCLC